MKKVMIGLTGCFLLALTTARPQRTHPAGGSPAGGSPHTTGSARSVADTTGQTQEHTVIARDTLPPTTLDTSFRYRGDTTIQVKDTTIQVKDTVISLADDVPAKKDTIPADPKTDPKPDNAKADIKVDDGKTDAKPVEAKDTTAEDKEEETKRQLDRRWFISPLLKLQFQDFAMLEKNRKGYLSDANTLPFFQRGNASFAASAYKNLTQRLSLSADIGLSFGHATSNNVLISQTKSKTYNLVNAALYYHLISPAYRLQPYVTVGFNDIISDVSYPTIPMGIGAKFNSRKIMVLGQVTYGQSISNNVASTTMYSLGIYIPIKSKKQKQLDQDDKSPYNRNNKDDAKKKDTANKNNGGSVTNNIYITINMDSVLRAKGLLDDNGNPITGSRRGGNGSDGGDDGGSPRSRRKKPFTSLGLDDFTDEDYKIDSLDGRPTLHFVVYFEFNEYGLTTKAFGNIDKVIRHLKSSSEFTVEIKGYTDSVGTDQYNNMLSRRRAKMVLDYLNSRGVPTELMKAKAYGSDNPVADNSDPNQAWLNRRAEIIIHRKDLASH